MGRRPASAAQGDSNYELTFALRGSGSDSGIGWEAGADDFRAEEPSSDEIPAVTATVNAAPTPLPWHHRFIETWGVALIGVTLAMIAFSLPVMAYGLWRMTDHGTSVIPAPSIFVAGLACTIALLVISIPLTLLAACLTELIRDLRRLRDQLERNAGVGPG